MVFFILLLKRGGGGGDTNCLINWNCHRSLHTTQTQTWHTAVARCQESGHTTTTSLASVFSWGIANEPFTICLPGTVIAHSGKPAISGWPGPQMNTVWLQHCETLEAEIGPFIWWIKMMNQGYSPVSLDKSNIKAAACQSWSPVGGPKWWDEGDSFQKSGSRLSKEWRFQEVGRVTERNISQQKQQGCWRRLPSAEASLPGNFRGPSQAMCALGLQNSQSVLLTSLHLLLCTPWETEDQRNKAYPKMCAVWMLYCVGLNKKMSP